MKKISKFTALLMVVCMLLPLGACGGKEETAGEGNTLKEKTGNVYTADFTSLTEAPSDISIFGIEGDTLYVRYYDYSQNYTNGIATLRTDGTEFNSIWSYTEDASSYSDDYYEYQAIQSCAVLPQGGMLAILSKYKSYMDGDNWVSEDSYTMLQLSQDGTVEREEDLKSIVESDEEYFDVWGLTVLSDGRLILETNNGLTLLNADWTFNRQLDLENSPTILATGSGDIIISYWDWETESQVSRLYDIETGELGDEDVFSEGVQSFYSYLPGKDYDLYLNDDTTVYGLDIGSGERTELFKWIDMDVSSLSDGYVVTDEGEFYFFENRYDENSSPSLVHLSLTDASNVPEKTELTYGCLYLDYDIEKKIIEFNRNNTEYRFTVKQYLDWTTDTSYEDSITKLNTDIIAGNIPDLLDLSQLPYENYVNSGVLADIGELIDGDSQLSREDFVQNVFDLLSVDGKIYTIVPGFGINSLVGKSSLVGDKTGWTMDDFKARVAELPEGTTAFDSYMSRQSFISTMVSYNLSQFIDRETGQCHFDSQTFIDYLEFAMTLPDDETLWADDGGDSYAVAEAIQETETYVDPYAEGTIMLTQAYISSFSDLGYYKYQFKDEVTLVGYPSEDGSGAMLTPQAQYGISAKTQYKDVVWEFARGFLTEEYQSQYTYYFPTNLKVLEDFMAESMKIPEIYDQEEIDMLEAEGYPLCATQEEVDETLALINSIDRVYMANSSVGEIMEEEVLAYFAGDKTAEETAKIVQSKVQTYINESR